MENKVEERVLDIRVRYDDAIRKIAEYRTQLDTLHQVEKTLNDDLKAERISREKYNLRLSETKVATGEVNDAIRVLNKQIQNQRKEQKSLEGSAEALRARLSNLTAEYDKLGRADRKTAKGLDLQAKINAVTDELKEAEEGTQRFYRNVGNYEDALKSFVGVNNDFANSLLNIAQNSNGVKGFFSNIKTEVSAFGSTLMSLLKNPVFMSIAGIAGVGFAFKWWYDYNKGLVEATKLTKQFTDKSGNDLKNYRSEVLALADCYGKDFRDTLMAINSVEKQFGISSEESLRIIKDGFIAGADVNGDFLKSLQEYPASFNEAGISADQFVAIIAETNKQGVFSDKGIDTIKEANTRLREMTTSTASALDGIGISSKQVQKDLQSGATTTFEVMQKVSAKLGELPDSSSAVGTAIADIFGGPGEDAGLQYIRTLKDISTNLDEVKGMTGELGKAEEDLLASQTELTKEIALLFDATGDSFEKMTAKIKTFVNDVLTDLIKDVRTLFESVEDISERESNAAVELGKSVASANIGDEYAKIAKARDKYMKEGLSEEKALKKAKEERLQVLNLSLKQEEEYLQETVTVNEKYNKELNDASFWRQGVGLDRTNSAINKDIGSSWKERMSQLSSVESRKETISLVSSYTGEDDKTKVTPPVDPKVTAAALKAKKQELQEIRKAEDEMLKLIKDSREKQTKEVEYEYSRQIEDLKVRLATEKALTPRAKEEIGKQIIALEKQKEADLQKLSDEALKKEIENRQKLISLQLESVKTGSEQEYQLKMQQLVAQRDAELQQKELTEQMKLAIMEKYNKKIDDLTDQHNNAVIKKQEDALKIRFETEIAQAYGNEQEILRIRMEQKFAELNSMQQMEGESIEAFNLRKLQAQNDYNDAKKTVAEKEIAIEQAKYDAMSTVTNGLIALTDAIGSQDRNFAIASKALAIAEIAINTGKAISKMVSAEAGKGIVGLSTMASGIATILSNIAAAISTVKSAKFAQGGSVVGPGSGTSDSIPAMLSNGESVMTAAATSMFTPLLSAFNQMGGGIPINVTASSNQALGEDMLAKAVAKGMMMAPPPVLSVEEYTSVANRIKYVENLGNV